MTNNELIKFIQNWALGFDARLSELVEALDMRVQGMQRELVRRFLEFVVDAFEFKDGKLTRTARNIRTTRKLERMFDGFVNSVVRPELNLFAGELMEVAGITAGYYQATQPSATEERVRQTLNLIRALIGIDEDGNLFDDGYINKLSAIGAIREAVRNYVVSAIVSKRSLSDFQKGFKLLIQGKPGVDGELQKYWRQYTYDTYNRVHEVANEAFAESLNLKYFIYQGSIIPTTRQFCRKKAGKVFSDKEAAEWRNDPDLIDQKTKLNYNPIIDRGRYNCRHFLTWISYELAVELRPELKKQAA